MNRVESDGDERSERNGMLYRRFELRLACPVYSKPTLHPLPRLLVIYASLFLN